jgi:hypothetical protein
MYDGLDGSTMAATEVSSPQQSPEDEEGAGTVTPLHKRG